MLHHIGPKTLFVALALSTLSFAPAATAEPKEPAAAPSPPPPSAVQLQASQAEARRLSDAFVNVAERVSPSVVQIDVTARDEGADRLVHMLGRGNGVDSPVARGTGSGVVFTPDGAILTNNHVVDEALTINVHLRDGRFLPARLVGRDPATDLAVVKVEATGLVAAKFADSDTTRVGEWVVAIGSPFGLGYTVTTGVLSARGRGGLGMNAIEDYLQTDASINPGNSGGPLCDLEGRVVGINSMIVGKGSGIGFAVPSNIARRAAEQILKTGHVERAWIGAGVQDLTPELAAAIQPHDDLVGPLHDVAVGDDEPAGLIDNHPRARPDRHQARRAGDLLRARPGREPPQAADVDHRRGDPGRRHPEQRRGLPDDPLLVELGQRLARGARSAGFVGIAGAVGDVGDAVDEDRQQGQDGEEDQEPATDRRRGGPGRRGVAGEGVDGVEGGHYRAVSG